MYIEQNLTFQHLFYFTNSINSCILLHKIIQCGYYFTTNTEN